jgi:hypothetical protein
MPPITAIITSAMIIFLELAESAEPIDETADDADDDADDDDDDDDDDSTIIFLLLYGYIIIHRCLI